VKIKILKENFPGEMPTGPSLGQPGGLKTPMPERQRKIMALIELVGSKLDELQNYPGIYSYVSVRWNNLQLEPKYRVNQYGEHFRQYGPDGKELLHTMEETAIIKAKRFADGLDIQKFKKVFGKTISQSIEVAKILEEVNQYLILIETLELDKDLALHVKKHIYKDRSINLDYAGTYIPRLFNYGDYLAASGLAIKSLATVIPQQLGEPSVGQAIKDTAESFTENFKSLWVMMSEELIASGDHLEKRSDFIEVIEPEILKYMMKMGHPVSLYDLRNEGFYEEMMKKHPIAGGGELRNRGGAKVMLRKALRTLIDKGYIVQDNFFENSRGMQTTFIINPQMAQQTGEEYFPKPEGIMESKKMKVRILKEATGEQKKQQRRDAYTSREKQRRKMKARIKRSQNKGEAPFKNERPDFDPIKDLGKAMKKQYKDLEVRANGEEINESLSNFNPSHIEKLAKMFVSGDLESIRQAVELSNGIGLETQIREESTPMPGGGTIFYLEIEFSNLEFIEIIKKLHVKEFWLDTGNWRSINFDLGGPGSMTIEKIIR